MKQRFDLAARKVKITTDLFCTSTRKIQKPDSGSQRKVYKARFVVRRLMNEFLGKGSPRKRNFDANEVGLESWFVVGAVFSEENSPIGGLD